MLKIQDIEQMRTGTIDNKYTFYAEHVEPDKVGEDPESYATGIESDGGHFDLVEAIEAAREIFERTKKPVQVRIILEVELLNGDSEFVEEHCRVDKMFKEALKQGV